MFEKMLDNVRNLSPLVHNITNYVTVNDCANILIACGGAPIMADDALEVEEITSICSALNINIGTLNQRTIESMVLAGKKSNELNHPVVLDPVGAGASKLRTDTANMLIEKVKFSVIRGNISEIKTLALGSGTTKGVDADISDVVNNENLDSVVNFAKAFAKKMDCVIIITGAIDIVTDKEKTYIIRNGHPMMSKITGSGCMLSAVLGAFIGANKDNILESCAAAVCAMGICGERAFARLKGHDGNSSYRNYLIDEFYSLESDTLKAGMRYEVR